MPGADLNAETTAEFLELGGDTSLLLRARTQLGVPGGGGQAVQHLGNLMLFQFYDAWKTRPVAAFRGALLVNTVWVKPGDERHEILATEATSSGREDPTSRLRVAAADVTPFSVDFKRIRRSVCPWL